MKTEFSKTWKGSVQPRKQRKYRHNAPSHVKGKFLSVPLSKELRDKYSTRNLRARVGDTIRILRGTRKTKEGKIQRIDMKNSIIYADGIEHSKKDGSKTHIPLQPSNLQIVQLNLDDKKRLEKLDKLKKQSSKDDKGVDKGDDKNG